MFRFHDSLYGLWVKGLYWYWKKTKLDSTPSIKGYNKNETCSRNNFEFQYEVFFKVLWLHAYKKYFFHKPSSRLAGQTDIITQILIYHKILQLLSKSANQGFFTKLLNFFYYWEFIVKNCHTLVSKHFGVKKLS